MLAAALDRPPVMLRLDVPADVETKLASHRVVRAGGQPAVVAGGVARAQALHFPTAPGTAGHARQAHAWFYLPGLRGLHGLPGFAPRADELPPLMVLLYGGPTSHAGPAYSTTAQFWTTRGYAVVDLNQGGSQATAAPTANACEASEASSTCRTPSPYGGSSGYGRTYRERLRGQWGVVDLQDAVAAVDPLVASGWATDSAWPCAVAVPAASLCCPPWPSLGASRQASTTTARPN